jgi:hypothetical protein
MSATFSKEFRVRKGAERGNFLFLLSCDIRNRNAGQETEMVTNYLINVE